MAGYYVPSAFSANYVANKKNEDGTSMYGSAVNKAGIDAQRNMQQLNKQYNQTINNAYASNLMANRGLQASSLGTGFKEAFAQNQQATLDAQVNQASLSVQDTKQNIFAALGQQLNQIGQAQLADINNMRRTASGLEQYFEYLKTLSNDKGSYLENNNIAGSFEQNYDNIIGLGGKGVDASKVAGYNDGFGKEALSWEDWFRYNSGTSEKDTAWLDWLYNGGIDQYRDFVKGGVNTPASQLEQKTAPVALPRRPRGR
jgi:hypothetical protein